MISNEYLKTQLNERNIVIQYAKNHFEEFKEQVDKATYLKYSSRCDIPGLACPSMIKYKRDKKLKKGKISKSIHDYKQYSVYIYSDDGTLLALKDYNQFGCDMTVYFFEKDGAYYAVPFRGESDVDYGIMIIKYTLLNGRVVEYHEIERCYIMSELYDYTNVNDGYIECDYSYYYDSTFSNISSDCIDSLNLKLKSIGISRENNIQNDMIRRYDYYYKICLNNEKVSEIEEYRLSDATKVFVRKL